MPANPAADVGMRDYADILPRCSCMAQNGIADGRQRIRLGRCSLPCRSLYQYNRVTHLVFDVANFFRRHGPRGQLARGLRILMILALVPTTALAQSDGFELNMRDVDIREFIDTVSKITGKTMIVDSRVTGKITLNSPRRVSAEQLYEIFLLQLGVNGFTVVDVGNDILKVIPNQAAKIEGIEVQSTISQPDKSENIITRIAQLKNVDVNKLIPTLRPLIDNRTGVITHYAESNVLLITDREANVRRILKIIDQVDQSGTQTTETVVLNNASADEIASILNKLIADNAKNQIGVAPSVTSDSRTNTLIINGDSDARQQLRKLVRQLDRNTSGAANIKVIYLRYAKAAELAKVLESVADSVVKGESAANGGVGRRNSEIQIQADEQTNALVISGSPHIIASLEDVVRKLDIRRAQVLVEAIIIEISDTRARELGVQWLFQGDDKGTRPVGGINFPGSGGSGIFNVGAAALGGDDSAAAAALAGIEGIAIGVGKLNSSLNFAALINALSTDGESNILSTPSLLTLDNKEATILVGREVPVITGATAGDNNTNPFQTISRQDIGVRLTVTPQINEGDAVQLQLEQEVSSLSNLSASDIITNKRIISTTVLVDDGATIVLGGLIDEDLQETTSRVPVIGSFPLLGRLFRSDTTQKFKRNLMVFIRPSIMRDGTELSATSGDKYNYMRAQQLLMQQRGVNLFPDKVAPVLTPHTTARRAAQPGPQRIPAQPAAQSRRQRVPAKPVAAPAAPPAQPPSRATNPPRARDDERATQEQIQREQLRLLEARRAYEERQAEEERRYRERAARREASAGQ